MNPAGSTSHSAQSGTGENLARVRRILLPLCAELSPVGVMETQPTNAPPALFASERGEFSCLPHAPFPGTGTWHQDGWHALTKRESSEFEREIGRAPACETCAAIVRNGGSR